MATIDEIKKGLATAKETALGIQSDIQKKITERDAGIITSDVLQGQTEIKPVVPQDTITTTPDIPEIPEQFNAQPVPTLTGQEQKQVGVLGKIKKLRGETLAEPEFRKTQEEIEGIRVKREELEKTRQRIQALQTEAQQVPLQLQEEAKGRGITVGGLRPLETARLRTNTIQLLGANAAFQFASGNLSLAQKFVDDAVAAEFDPIKAKIDAEIQNLELLKADPRTTLQEKKRADETLARKEAEKTRVEEAKADKETIFEIMGNAAQAGADDSTLDKIQRAKSPEEALRTASDAGVFVEEPTFDTTGPKDKTLSINQVEQFRRSFGWTPPKIFTLNQLDQFITDNPGATPEELQAKAEEIAGGGGTTEIQKQMNDFIEYAKGKGFKINEETGEVIDPSPELIKEFNEKFDTTIPQTPETVITSIMEDVTKDQLKALKKKADEAGISKILRFKKGDVRAFLDSISDIIQEAINEGSTTEEILSALTG